MDADVTWLSPEEQATWRAFLTGHQLLLRALDHQLRRDSGISHSDYGILVSLSERAGGTTRITELATLLDHSQSRTSHAVTRLENNGLLDRLPDEHDGRGVQVRMTDAGWAALRCAAPGHVRLVRQMFFDAIGPAELDTLRSACDAVLERLHAAEGSGGMFR